MNNKSNITVLIPMKNEQRHIARSVKSALRLTPNVFVIDSDSTDGSIAIAESLGAKVFQYEWTSASNFSTKINWALNNLPITTTWAIRLDADEYFMDNCIECLENSLKDVSPDVNGITLIRRIYFMGRWMKHSAEYPKTSMRIFRVGHVEMESRWLDEHVDVKEGKAIDFPYDIVDDSHILLTEWTAKHNGYSNREVIELIHQDIGLFNRNDTHLDKNAIHKKRNKNIYSKLPRYWRAFFFFFYRYFIRLGFLDGKEGFLWNFLQCWWYRTIADAKMDEVYAACGRDKDKIATFMETYYGLKIKE
jgi:glycosyltransferase involved in cell wall biosynthesis